MTTQYTCYICDFVSENRNHLYEFPRNDGGVALLCLEHANLITQLNEPLSAEQARELRTAIDAESEQL